jgi:uncharacterized protein (DUF433 family)
VEPGPDERAALHPAYPSREDLIRNYPELEEEDIRRALAYAAANLEDQAEPWQVA